MADALTPTYLCTATNRDQVRNVLDGTAVPAVTFYDQLPVTYGCAVMKASRFTTKIASTFCEYKTAVRVCTASLKSKSQRGGIDYR